MQLILRGVPPAHRASDARYEIDVLAPLRDCEMPLEVIDLFSAMDKACIRLPTVGDGTAWFADGEARTLLRMQALFDAHWFKNHPAILRDGSGFPLSYRGLPIKDL